MPEGTTRSLVQRGGKGLSKGLQNVFVPRVGIEELGGLPGLIMVLADGNRERVRIHGPPVLTHWLASARSYARRDAIAVSVNEVPMLSTFASTGRLSTAAEPATSNGDKEQSAEQAGLLDDQGEEDFVIFQDTNITVKAFPVLPSGFVLPQSQRRLQGLSSPASKKRKVDRETLEDVRENLCYPPTERAKSFLRQMFPNDHGHKVAPPSTDVKEGEEVQSAQEEALAAAASEHEKDALLKRKLKSRANASKMALDEPPLQPIPSSSSSQLFGQAPALTYVVIGNPTRGKFNAPAAAALGVAPGENYGKLGAGKDVEIQRPKAWHTWNEDKRREWLQQSKKANVSRSQAAKAKSKKRAAQAAQETGGEKTKGPQEEMETITVKSSDVVAPSKPGAVFVQVVLPHRDYLAAFLSEAMQEQLSPYRQGDRAAHAIVHAVHPSILADEAYLAFMRSFPLTNHIITSRSYLPDKLSFPSSALANLRMSHLDPQLFRVPKYELEPRSSLEGVDNVFLAGLDTEVPLQPAGPPRPMEGDAPDFDFPLESKEAEGLAAFTVDNKSNRKLRPEVKKAKEVAWTRFVDLAAHVQRMILSSTNASKDEDIESQLKFTTLGTGSAQPSKYRNVSATLVHLPKRQGYMLLDAGESTYGQLCRVFGKGVDSVLRDIRVVFLSHVHGDHHMGFTRLLAERRKLDPPATQRLYVIANNFTRGYLEEVDQIFSLGLIREGTVSSGSKASDDAVVLLECEHLDYAVGVSPDPVTSAEAASKKESERDEIWQAKLKNETIQRVLQGKLVLASFKGVNAPEGDSSAVELNERQVKEINRVVNGLVQSRIKEREKAKAHLEGLDRVLGGAKVFTAEVDHRAMHCYGVVVRSESSQPDRRGFSFAYSGDTRPCLNLVKAGKDVDVLVHEATIEDSEPEMAHMKGHSTFGQAIDIGIKMGAKRVLLTHFSQRYPKLPRLSYDSEKENAGKRLPIIALAFDLMTIAEGQMERMKHFQGALELLFDADEEVEEGLNEVASAPEDNKSSQKASDPAAKKANGSSNGVSSKPVEGKMQQQKEGADIAARES